MCYKETITASPFDVLSHVGPRLIPFFKTVIIYFVAWIPEESPCVSGVVLKCLPVLCLIPFVGVQGLSFQDEHKYQRRVFVGLIFSCIGDALLIWPHYYFVQAMAAFGIAHVAYIRAFGFCHPYRWLKGLPFFAGFVAVVLLFYPGLSGILIPGVAIYCFLIASMGWRAFARVDILENIWSWTSLFGCIGAALFIMSDTLIGVNKFVTPIPFARALIMTTYYAAQVFIAMSAVNTSDLLVKLKMTKKQLPQLHAERASESHLT